MFWRLHSFRRLSCWLHAIRWCSQPMRFGNRLYFSCIAHGLCCYGNAVLSVAISALGGSKSCDSVPHKILSFMPTDHWKENAPQCESSQASSRMQLPTCIQFGICSLLSSFVEVALGETAHLFVSLRLWFALWQAEAVKRVMAQKVAVLTRSKWTYEQWMVRKDGRDEENACVSSAMFNPASGKYDDLWFDDQTCHTSSLQHWHEYCHAQHVTHHTKQQIAFPEPHNLRLNWACTLWCCLPHTESSVSSSPSERMSVSSLLLQCENPHDAPSRVWSLSTLYIGSDRQF